MKAIEISMNAPPELPEKQLEGWYVYDTWDRERHDAINPHPLSRKNALKLMKEMRTFYQKEQGERCPRERLEVVKFKEEQ